MLKYLVIFCLYFCITNLSIDGIDVSVHQGPNIDFNKVKKAGKNFVIIRAGYGKNTKDDYFDSNYKKAKNAGLNVGAYWYSYAVDVEGSTKEAQKCLSVIKGKKFEYPIYYDLEDPGTTLQQNKETVSNMANNFCTRLQNEGYFCGLYSSKSHFETHFSNKVQSAYTIWVAQYNNKCYYKGNYRIWQYSSKGSVSGISGNVDLDVSYEDFPTLIKNKHFNGY